MRLVGLLVCATLACSILASAQETPSPGKVEQGSRQGNKNSAKSQPKSPPTVPIQNAQAPVSSDTKGSNKNAANAESAAVKIVAIPHVAVETTRDLADWVIWGLTILLFAIGVYQIFLLRGTLDVTRIAADAASRSAEALIRGDRAWLVIRPDNFSIAPSNRFDWIVTNVGRSTAKILEASVRCRTDISWQRTLPPTPEHNQPILVHGTPIAPGEQMKFWCGFDAFDPNYNAIMDAPLTAQNINDILQQKTDLVPYGYVKYEDAFGNAHESRFCAYFAHWAKDFRINLTAPAEYHCCD